MFIIIIIIVIVITIVIINVNTINIIAGNMVISLLSLLLLSLFTSLSPPGNMQAHKGASHRLPAAGGPEHPQCSLGGCHASLPRL